MNASEDPSKPEGSAPEAAAGSRPAVSGSRRRLLRGGLAAAPALLALKSAPVMACNCKAPSGFSTSGNLSRNGNAGCGTDVQGNAPGWGPNSWAGNTNGSGYYCQGTQSTGCKPAGRFCDLFGGTDTTSLSSCLALGPTKAKAAAVACYLQAKISGNDANFPGTATIKAVGNCALGLGTYKPPSALNAWTADTCKGYLAYLTGRQPGTVV